jgi:plastocyanin
MKFEPAVVTVKKGDTVTWINNDLVDHDITEERSKLWRSSTLKPGQRYSRVVKTGADYFCSIHVVMKGKLKVN